MTPSETSISELSHSPSHSLWRVRRPALVGLLLIAVSWQLGCGAADTAEEQSGGGGETAVAVSTDDSGDETPEQAMARTWASWNDPAKQKVEPFRIFDNLSYIGMEWVSAYVLETSDGLILIDTLYGDFIEHAVDGIRKLGLDPDDIKIVLATHAHFDHNGGIAFFKREYGAQIGMTEADWELSEKPAEDPRFAYETIARDLVLGNGDTVTLGETTITTYVTPGHTEGVLSLDFEVQDGDQRYRAFTFGGVGLNFSSVARTESYLESVARIREWNAGGERPISVNISNHAGVGRIFERRDRLAERREGALHPFVDPEGYVAWLDTIEEAAREKLEQERLAEQDQLTPASR